MADKTCEESSPGSARDAVDSRGVQLVDRLAHWARCQPAAIAVTCRNEQLTYADLERRVRLIAAHLRARGVRPREVVGICHDRDANLVALLLGMFKVGCGYLPIDVRYPEQRVALMVREAGLHTIIVSAGAYEQLSGWLPDVTLLRSDGLMFESNDCGLATEESDTAGRADDIAYILFTSGSTGPPKGVIIERQSLTHFLQWCQTRMTRRRLSAVFATSSLSFDSSVFEIFAPLWAGGTVLVIESALHAASFPNVPSGALFSCPPSVASELLRTKWMPKEIGSIVLAGERVSVPLVEALHAEFENVTVFNCYGLTEATVFSTLAELDRQQSEPVPIGKPIIGTEVYVLDERLQPAPASVTGEIYIGGRGLARGYLNREELTAGRFVANPHCGGKRMLRTGDAGHRRPDGDFVCTGRIDEQIKLYGFRIEPGEIENCLCSHPAVSHCKVLVRRVGHHDKLVAYYVSTDTTVKQNALRAFLQRQLPEHMIPAHWVPLDKMPLNVSGKVDRARLLEQPLLG